MQNSAEDIVAKRRRDASVRDPSKLEKEERSKWQKTLKMGPVRKRIVWNMNDMWEREGRSDGYRSNGAVHEERRIYLAFR